MTDRAAARDFAERRGPRAGGGDRTDGMSPGAAHMRAGGAACQGRRAAAGRLGAARPRQSGHARVSTGPADGRSGSGALYKWPSKGPKRPTTLYNRTFAAGSLVQSREICRYHRRGLCGGADRLPPCGGGASTRRQKDGNGRGRRTTGRSPQAGTYSHRKPARLPALSAGSPLPCQAPLPATGATG